MSIEYSFKIISIGSNAVGKTSLIRRFTENTFEETYIETLGVDFAVKQVRLQNRYLEFKLFDTAGEEKFGSLRPFYYRGAQGTIIVFDLTRRRTFDKLNEWLSHVYINCGTISSILVGNKNDLPDREVSMSEAEKFASNKNLPYIETSAKTGDNVERMFTNLANSILKIEYPQL
ncbi:MAG: Rab family GTPase [Candidatus Hodarchaeota archaeon]